MGFFLTSGLILKINHRFPLPKIIGYLSQLVVMAFQYDFQGVLAHLFFFCTDIYNKLSEIVFHRSLVKLTIVPKRQQNFKK